MNIGSNSNSPVKERFGVIRHLLVLVVFVYVEKMIESVAGRKSANEDDVHVRPETLQPLNPNPIP